MARQKMNKFIISFLIGINICYAATYETDNEGGGKIVLTDRECKNYPALRQCMPITQQAYIWMVAGQ